jgi:hypothetical protein
MSAQDVKAVTSKNDFYDYSNVRVFSVNEGVPVRDAVLAAACFAEAIKNLAEVACDDEDAAPKASYAIAFLAETVQALCNAVELGIAVGVDTE